MTNGHYDNVDYDDDDDDDEYLYDDTAEMRGRGEHRGSVGGSSHQDSASPGDDLNASDVDDGSMVRHASGESKNKRKKKKKRHMDAGHSHRHTDIWYKSDAEEKQRIREFWLQLGED